ncbi:HET-domain-containing protein [Hyaloscypha variabilis F]|uniref:HET-domain-containing protein n=1 Tax=Hyaloscypha variabilis (strain UAMH 11265 / GT02V1 / F) TaxID=1149755 RepID=A0A2J6SAV0_HYAVF|nr:HET-domain-containing protein [Hyaloscypha variabilis F]
MEASSMAAISSNLTTTLGSESADSTQYSRRCKRCADIVLHNPLTRAWELRNVAILSHPAPLLFVSWHLTIDGSEKILDQGIIQDCAFCKTIRDHQDTTAQYDTLGESPHLVAIVQDYNTASCTFGTSKQHGRIPVTLRSEFCVQAFASKAGDFVLSVNQDDPVAIIMKKRPPLLSLDSDHVFGTANNWIRDCLANHGASCSNTAAGYNVATPLPKRVLDVREGDPGVRLMQPAEGSVGRYVALSYCWGVRPQVVLTSKAVECGDCIFSMSALPPTIKDAVTICRRLGYQYLWVDALCIIQDSPDSEDWIEQSARMDQIYGNAALTIAAASGTSVWDGILNPTTEVPPTSCTIPFMWWNLKVPPKPAEQPPWPEQIPDSKVSVRFYPYVIDAKQPLFHRAWTFQEEALSLRILRFQKDQIVWHCKSKKIYADGPVNTEQIKVFNTWEEVVVEYTKRIMTFEDDRLMALAGYAKAKQNELDAKGIPNRYLGGLWEADLVDQLLWISKVKPPPPRPKSYRAPTWSWASINGPVEFVAADRKGSPLGYLDLISVSLSTNPVNSFGTLAKDPPSYLHIKAYLKAVPEIELPCQTKPLPTNKDFRRGIGKHWWIEFDVIDVRERTDLGFRSNETLYCLRVTEFTALLLVPVAVMEGTDCFERVGIVRHWQREKWTWFDEVEEKTELYLM